jgi:hypothetical protein
MKHELVCCAYGNWQWQPTSIASYNHLGNNDGMNLSAPQTFRSKEISKSGVVDDMVSSNAILYEPGEHPDHVIVIKVRPPPFLIQFILAVVALIMHMVWLMIWLLFLWINC